MDRSIIFLRNRLYTVSNRTFDARFSYNCRHFIIGFDGSSCLRLLFRWDSYSLPASNGSPLSLALFVYSSTLIPLFDFSNTCHIADTRLILFVSFLQDRLSVFVPVLHEAQQIASCPVVPFFLPLSTEFPPLFSTEISSRFTRSERIANASKAILEMLLSALLFLPDLHPPRVLQTCHVTKRVFCEARDSAFLTYVSFQGKNSSRSSRSVSCAMCF